LLDFLIARRALLSSPLWCAPFEKSTNLPDRYSRWIYIHTYSGVLFCSSIYTHTHRREWRGSLSSHTHIQQQVPIFRCIAFLDGWCLFFPSTVYILYTVC
jgi:hypothetical protein